MVDNPSRLNNIFQAVSHETRREIVTMLAKRPHGFGELAERFDVSKAAISKHVKVLEQVGILERDVKGRTHTYRLNADAMHEAYAWLSVYEKFWSSRLDALKRVLEKKGKLGGKR